MFRDRRLLVLWIGQFALASMMLPIQPLEAFAFTVNDQCTRAIMYSQTTKQRPCSRLWRRRRMSMQATSANNKDDESISATTIPTPTTAVGLYKQYADYAVRELLGTGWLIEDESVPVGLSANQVPARGAKTESVVRITTQALVPKTDITGPPLVRYARITLLETVPLDSTEEEGALVSSDGIQVLNFVVLPNADTTLPVLGIDLVTLPGSKHLLLLDAQPMVEPNPHEDHWKDWYHQYVTRGESSSPRYAWGGDFPEAVQKYVSKHALWTRLQNLADGDGGTSPAVDAIRDELFEAFRAHLDAYLELLGNFAGDVQAVVGANDQPSYLDYRRNNDPAKPMLNRLYGPEWTQSLLDNVLFPKD